MDVNKASAKNNKDLKHLDIDIADTASATDFTGMIPANPQLVEELDAYKAIHEFGYEAGRE